MMPRASTRFTQADIARAAKGMLAAGLHVTGARIDREGNIEVLCGERPMAQPVPVEAPTSLSEWRKQKPHGAR